MTSVLAGRLPGARTRRARGAVLMRCARCPPTAWRAAASELALRIASLRCVPKAVWLPRLATPTESLCRVGTAGGMGLSADTPACPSGRQARPQADFAPRLSIPTPETDSIAEAGGRASSPVAPKSLAGCGANFLLPAMFRGRSNIANAGQRNRTFVASPPPVCPVQPKMASAVISFSDKHAAEVNRKALARADPAVEEVVVTVAHSAIYAFEQPRGVWVSALSRAAHLPRVQSGPVANPRPFGGRVWHPRPPELRMLVEWPVASIADQAGSRRSPVCRPAKLDPDVPHRAHEPVEHDEFHARPDRRRQG